MKNILFLIIFIGCPGLLYGQSDAINYSVPKEPWSESFGNHRAVIRIEKSSDAVLIDFMWRRHDASPESRHLMIVNSETGEKIPNIFRVNIDNERCELVFGPVDKTGLYYFYYLPYTPETRMAQTGEYLPVEANPDDQWVNKHHLNEGLTKYRNVTKAEISEIQARTEFHSFYPMEVIATKSEVKSYLAKQKEDFLVFPEDRKFPIRMSDAIPLRWIKINPGGNLSGNAQKNEYYALQLGLFASQKDLQNVKLYFSDLTDNGGNIIPAKSITCFNTDGIDIDGKPFSLKINVTQGMVQPMWIGIDIPGDAIPGVYEGEVVVKPENLEGKKVKVILEIENRLLADRGDGEPWRHSRLRWLNSTLGIDDEAVAPYIPLVVDKQKISSLGVSVWLNNSGFPDMIESWGNNILSSSLKFVIDRNNRIEELKPVSFSYKKQKNGIVTWEGISENDDVKLICNGELEFDGRLFYDCQIISKNELHVQDIRLELPFKKAFATYMIGMGRMGGLTPETHMSRWIKKEDSFWIGDPAGGIHCELRGDTYNGPLRTLYQPDPTRMGRFDPLNPWANARDGGFRIDTEGNTVTAAAFSGPRQISKGDSVSFKFALLITPVKKLDTRRGFTERYVHSTTPIAEEIANGANILNIHHANEYNPFINFPFIATKELQGMVDKWHAKGWKVKIYYTIRELTNHMTEIWALRSLGFEILSDGPGGGYQWLREHLVKNYTKQWYTHLGNGEVDAAILSSGESRYYNYYVEGLNWLIKNMDIDGLYLDDVSYDRRILKRMRKVMEMNKPGCLIDLHSNNQFSSGPTNQYLEYYPYIDRTLYGEGFLWNTMPAEYWLTETSGIPFGLMNDVFFQDPVNNRKGMNFGMTVRIGKHWAMWKLWDQFGIADSEMHGYWEKNPVVTLDHKNVYATTYIKEGKTLISIGSWVREPVNVLMSIDWKRLGLNPSEVNITAPEIDFYQKEKSFKLGDPIPVDENGDCILIISRK